MHKVEQYYQKALVQISLKYLFLYLVHFNAMPTVPSFQQVAGGLLHSPPQLSEKGAFLVLDMLLGTLPAIPWLRAPALV